MVDGYVLGRLTVMANMTLLRGCDHCEQCQTVEQVDLNAIYLNLLQLSPPVTTFN